MESRRQRRERERRESRQAVLDAKATAGDSNERFDSVLALVSVACTLASWGWSVVAPNTSAIFASILFLIAIIAMLFAVRRMWPLGQRASFWIAAVALLGFISFDWYIVIKPQRGKPFQALFVHGYHLTSECGSLTGNQQMPVWMRDESREWQAKVEQLIADKLAATYSQLWQGAVIVGRVSDEGTIAYQCTWLANKVGALETIVSSEYDSSLRHRDYNGPTYWFEPVNGKVDISDAFRGGKQQANIAIEGLGGNDKRPGP